MRKKKRQNLKTLKFSFRACGTQRIIFRPRLRRARDNIFHSPLRHARKNTWTFRSRLRRLRRARKSIKANQSQLKPTKANQS
jgi:hypothetical protein